MLVYESRLDNQHKAVHKFAKRWFGPYTMMSANDNGTYHLIELDGTRIVVPVAGKRIKVFKKRHVDNRTREARMVVAIALLETTTRRMKGNYGPVFSGSCCI